MPLIDSLETGRFGLTLQLPRHLEILRDEKTSAQLVDTSKNVVWFFYFLPDLHLDLHEEHRANMKRSLEPYARAMFEDVFQQLHPDDQDRQPRTTDSEWSPMIDVEYSSIGDTAVLRTVHRMAYEPGHEMIMGHVLVPLEKGLFEARVLTVDKTTGYRESILLVKQMQEQTPNDEEDPNRQMATIRQRDYDDPQHDEAFPEHALSRSRAALRWLIHDANLRVTERPLPLEQGEVQLPHLNCALMPPPRFFHEDAEDPQSPSASFHRVSFCGTDGIERLIVHRWDDVARNAKNDNFAKLAKSLARTMHEESGVQGLRLIVKKLAQHASEPQVLVIVEGKGHQGLLRNAMLFFQDEQQRTWSLSRCGTAAVPPETLKAELIETVRTFRIEASPKSPKPWWKFW